MVGDAPSSSATDARRRELTPNAATLRQLLRITWLPKTVYRRVVVFDEAGLNAVSPVRDLNRIANAIGCRLHAI